MNIVLLTASHGLHPAAIVTARAELGLSDADLLSVVSWRRPASPLPVDRHLLLGPHAPLLRNVVAELATATRGGLVDDPPAVAPVTDDLDEAFAQESLGAAPVSSTEATELGADESADESADGRLDTDPDDGPASEPDPAKSTLLLPVVHPRRIRQALAWRYRRLRRAARRRLNRARKARPVRMTLNLEVSAGFAATCWRAPAVTELAEQADLIVALDAAAYRGAWALSKKVAGPAVVIGLPAGKRFRESGPGSAAL